MYGTKDAAQCFDVACENAMTKMGYTIGLSLSVIVPSQGQECGCVPARGRLRGLRHADPAGGVQERVRAAFHREAAGYFGTLPGVGRRARGAYLEPAGKMGEAALRQWSRAAGVRGRTRHVEVIVHQLGLSCSSKECPRRGKGASRSVDFGTPLGRVEHVLYRSATM